MEFTIRMGIPEMAGLWNKLQTDSPNGTNGTHDDELNRQRATTRKTLAKEPLDPGLNTHEIDPLSKRYGMKVWQSYLENRRSGARRMFWVYGPNQNEITIIGLEPHPEDAKNGAYDRITLSDLR